MLLVLLLYHHKLLVYENNIYRHLYNEKIMSFHSDLNNLKFIFEEIREQIVKEKPPFLNNRHYVLIPVVIRPTVLIIE